MPVLFGYVAPGAGIDFGVFVRRDDQALGAETRRAA